MSATSIISASIADHIFSVSESVILCLCNMLKTANFASLPVLISVVIITANIVMLGLFPGKCSKSGFYFSLGKVLTASTNIMCCYTSLEFFILFMNLGLSIVVSIICMNSTKSIADPCFLCGNLGLTNGTSIVVFKILCASSFGILQIIRGSNLFCEISVSSLLDRIATTVITYIPVIISVLLELALLVCVCYFFAFISIGITTTNRTNRAKVVIYSSFITVACFLYCRSICLILLIKVMSASYIYSASSGLSAVLGGSGNSYITFLKTGNITGCVDRSNSRITRGEDYLLVGSVCGSNSCNKSGSAANVDIGRYLVKCYAGYINHGSRGNNGTRCYSTKVHLGRTVNLGHIAKNNTNIINTYSGVFCFDFNCKNFKGSCLSGHSNTTTENSCSRSISTHHKVSHSNINSMRHIFKSRGQRYRKVNGSDRICLRVYSKRYICSFTNHERRSCCSNCNRAICSGSCICCNRNDCKKH